MHEKAVTYAGKRAMDLLLAAGGLLLALLPMLLIALAVKLTSKGPALYWSNRVGRTTVCSPCRNSAPCASIPPLSRRTCCPIPMLI